jgi:hypothetical protein
VPFDLSESGISQRLAGHLARLTAARTRRQTGREHRTGVT